MPLLAQHPLKKFLEHGIIASLNTDDPAVEGIELKHEYTVAAPAAGFNCSTNSPSTQINGLTMAFISQAERDALIKKVSLG